MIYIIKKYLLNIVNLTRLTRKVIRGLFPSLVEYFLNFLKFNYF